MLVHVPGVLTSDEVRQVRSIIEAEAWIDGKATAGDQAATAKFNLQIAEGSPAAMQAGDIILMHDWCVSTLEALPRILSYLETKQLCSITLADLCA